MGNLELHLDQLDDSQEEGRVVEREGEGEDQDSGINNGPGSAPSSAHLGGSKNNGLIHRYSTPRNSDVFLRAPASGLVSDLLSELQFSDSQKLKQQLLQVGRSLSASLIPSLKNHYLAATKFCLVVVWNIDVISENVIY